MTSRNGLDVRPPLQRRTREAWTRVLDAGVAIVEEGGYEAFTIAAVCGRAQVAPRAIYDRVDTKDGLFLAVYEHGLARVRGDQDELRRLVDQPGLRSEALASAVADVLVRLFARHRRWLRAVVLVSGAHPEVTRRGAAYSRELGEMFATVLLRHPEDVGAPDPQAAVRAVFEVVFATLVFRAAYGTEFSVDPADPAVPTGDDELARTLADVVSRFLVLAPAGARERARERAQKG